MIEPVGGFLLLPPKFFYKNYKFIHIYKNFPFLADAILSLIINPPLSLKTLMHEEKILHDVRVRTNKENIAGLFSSFRKEMDRLHMVQSFSAKGHTYDNAVMECFFKYLKKEESDRRHFQTIDQLKQRLLSYIAGFYNPVRPHSHNHGLSPDQRERQSIS